MPVLDWTRTDLEYVLPDGSKALRFDQIEFAAFELHILKRPGAEADYTEEEIAQAAVRFATMSDEDKARLTRNIIAGLPGAEEGYTLDQFRKHLELYKDIDKAKLRENFAVFLKAIIPVAEEVGVRMAVHPDDPPRPILGLPRIVSTIEDMQWMVDTVNSMANGFTMCTGSYGVRADNDLVDMIKQFGPRIYFTHLRSTMREDNPKTFHEAAHLNGDVDMYEVVKAIVEEEHRRKAEGKEDLIRCVRTRSSDAGRPERRKPILVTPAIGTSERPGPKFAVSNWRSSALSLAVNIHRHGCAPCRFLLPCRHSLKTDSGVYDDYYC